MSVIKVSTLEDPRLDPYRQIRHRNFTQQSGWFVAEGPILVEELLRSDFECRSVVVERKFLERFEPLVPASVDLFVLDSGLVNELVGFKFHRGIIGCGSRRPLASLESIAQLHPEDTLAGLVGIHDPENLGGILRNCAGLGIRHVLIGPSNADPFSRRALRVAMGTTFELNLIQCSHPKACVQQLKQQFDVVSYATALNEDSVPIEEIHCRQAALVWFGNEKRGLPEDLIETCNHQIQIQMHLGVDSLNVNVAAGIILHYFRRLSHRPIE